MKGMRKLLIILLSAILWVGIMDIPVFAAEILQDGLKITLESDKEQYSKNEKINTLLKVKNTNDFAVTNILLEQIAPKGYIPDSNSEVSKKLEVLKEGEEVSLTVTFMPQALISNEEGKNNSKNDELTNLEVGDNNQNKAAIEMGDKNNVFLFFIIFMVSVLMIGIIIIVKAQKTKQILSLLLIIVVSGSSVLGYVTPVEAKHLEHKVELEHSIEVEDSSMCIMEMLIIRL